MRIGLIGLGDIALKGYLPVLTQIEDIEVILCTRNEKTLLEVAKKYKIKETHSNDDNFFNANLDGVFICTATQGHYHLAQKAIRKGIPAHIDKPISLSFDETKEIFDLSHETGVPFTVGFNRRFTPHITKVKENGTPNLVVYQKNRHFVEDDVRRFIVEDFIHAIDTTKFLLGSEIIDIKSSGSISNDGKLKHVVVHLKTKLNEAICIMNYRNGITEERVEVNYDDLQFLIHDYQTLTIVQSNSRISQKQDDWQSNLHKRGFIQMCESFINSIKNSIEFKITADDALETHIIVEKIVKQLEEV